MSAALLSLLLAATARAQEPAAVVASVMAKTDAFVAQEAGKDVRDVAALDRRTEELFRDISPLGWHAAAPLGEAARDPKRSAKARLFAVTFLSRLHAPAAFAPLASFLLDPEKDADARQAAAQGLEALEAPPEAGRRVLCLALSQPDLPRAVLDETLIAPTRLGCGDFTPLERIARSFGPRPSDRDLASARRALTALAHSRGEAPLRRLLALMEYFPPKSAARAAAIAALDARRRDLASAPEELSAARNALLSETNDPAAMLVLVRLADDSTALSHARGEAPLRRLLALMKNFSSERAARAAAIAALDARPRDLASAPEAFPAVRAALLSETEDPATMLILVRLADALGPPAGALLLPLASHPDVEVLSAAAEALARRKSVKALPALEAVIAGALNDPRFAPRPGRPDPALLLARIEAAADSLRRARAARR